jgi:hypothetical protein
LIHGATNDQRIIRLDTADNADEIAEGLICVKGEKVVEWKVVDAIGGEVLGVESTAVDMENVWGDKKVKSPGII